jgi:hypothetical protein
MDETQTNSSLASSLSRRPSSPFKRIISGFTSLLGSLGTLLQRPSASSQSPNRSIRQRIRRPNNKNARQQTQQSQQRSLDQQISQQPSRGRTLTLAGLGLAGIGAAAFGISRLAGGGSGPAAPAPVVPAATAPAPTTSPTEGLEATRAALLRKLDGAIAWRANPNHVAHIPSEGPHPLTNFVRFQGQGGLSSKDAAISGGTREELIKLAEAAGITDTNKQNEMIALYTKAYNNAYISAYDPLQKTAAVDFGGDVTGSVHANAMTESLKAVGGYIKNEQNYQASLFGRVEELVGHILPKGAPVSAAEGAPVMASSAPSPLATMMQGAVSRLEGVAHNVAVVAQHPAAQAAMRGLGVVGVVASVAKTVHEARSGNTALAVMNGAAAVATAAATVGMPPVAAAAGLARIGAYAADRSQTGTLDRVLAQKTELTNKLATLKAESPTLGSRVQTVTTHVALATKKADVLASQQLNALRGNVQSGVEATSQMLTQAQEVAETTMETASSVVQSTRDRVAAFFTQRHAAAL